MHKPQSAIFAVVHETASGLHKAGIIDQISMREFDQLCLAPIDPPRPSAEQSDSGGCPP